MSKIICIIPARMSSSRFQGKPLAKIKGREMVLRMCDIARATNCFDRIIVATEDLIIKTLCELNGYESMITEKHYTCTHRVAECSRKVDSDYIVNLQGDEPLIQPEWIKSMVEYGVDNNYDMVQACHPLEDNSIEDEDAVKMIISNGKCTHICRIAEQITPNVVGQAGLYMYKKNVIEEFPNMDMGLVQAWRGLDTQGFIGRIDVMPYMLPQRTKAIDRPHHIQEVECLLS
jgi:3-deoxy-manno-octulosonate cytidylyltransferase (CMP-KDO synthetase)